MFEKCTMFDIYLEALEVYLTWYESIQDSIKTWSAQDSAQQRAEEVHARAEKLMRRAAAQMQCGGLIAALGAWHQNVLDDIERYASCGN